MRSVSEGGESLKGMREMSRGQGKCQGDDGNVKGTREMSR